MSEFERVRVRAVPAKSIVLAVGLATVMFALNIPNIGGQSITVDEYAHLPAGYSYLLKKDFHMYPKNPPLIKMIAAIPAFSMKLQFPAEPFYMSKGGWAPWEFADKFVEKNRADALRIWAAGRVMIMVLGVCLAVLVFYWACLLYGEWAGLLAMFLTVTSPNILAHASLTTVDLGFTLFFVLTWFMIWKFLDDPKAFTLVGAGVAFGAAQISKFSGLLMIPILIIVVIALIVRNEIPSDKRNSVTFGSMAQNNLFIVLIVLAGGLTIINAGYFAKKTFEPLKTNVHLSNTLMKIADTGFGDRRMPLPGDYIAGLDGQLADAERGEFPNYINGAWRQKGVWYYFIEAIGLKETIPALALIVLGLVVGLWRSAMHAVEIRRPLPTVGPGQPAWPFVHLPAVVFLAFSSLFGNLQLGLRYVLPVLPLLFIAASRIAGGHISDVRGKPKMEKGYSIVAMVVVILLFLWQCVTLGLSAPHYLSYFNEIAGGSKEGPKYFLDSNIDWGQDLPGLKREMKKLGVKDIGLLYFGHADPALYGIEYHLPRPGDQFVAVSVNFLYGYPYSLTYLAPWKERPPMVTDEANMGSFLFAQSLFGREPAERIGGSIYLYDLRGSM